MFLDTSGLLCFLFDSQPLHQLAIASFTTVRVRFTHSLVISEFIAVCTARKLNRTLCLDFASDLIAGDEVEVVDVRMDELLRGISLLRSYSDKQWSLCDAVSINLMRERNVFEALTTDHHFNQAGLHALLTLP